MCVQFFVVEYADKQIINGVIISGIVTHYDCLLQLRNNDKYVAVSFNSVAKQCYAVTVSGGSGIQVIYSYGWITYIRVRSSIALHYDIKYQRMNLLRAA
jgi:hypothetical protein